MNFDHKVSRFRLIIRFLKEWMGYYRPSFVKPTMQLQMPSTAVDMNAFREFAEEMSKIASPARANMAGSHKPRYSSNNGIVTDNLTGQVVHETV